MCMIHKHTTVSKAYGMCYKQNIDFFVCIGLVPSKWWFYFKMWGIYTIKEYVEQQTWKYGHNDYSQGTAPPIA